MTREDELLGRVFDARYRVSSRLGRGGMGTVYKVQHVTSHEWFALKVLHPTIAADPMMVERFVREARAAAALKSRHVVRVIDAQRDHVGPSGDKLPYLVMELLEGSNVETLLERKGKLTPGEVAWLMTQVGRALSLAHDKGIVHRDLKPENLYVAIDDEGQPVAKVCDFGIAKLVGEAASGLMATGALETAPSSLGTPMYMSPEQLRDSSAVDARTDQWSLALIVFRALAGKEFFADARSSGQLMAKILVEPMKTPSERGFEAGGGIDAAGFDRWFARSCAREPERRWSTVAEQVAALQEVLRASPEPIAIERGVDAIESAVTGGLPAAQNTGAPSATTAPVPQRRRAAPMLFGAGAIALGALLFVATRDRAPAATAHEPAAPPTPSAPAPPAAPSAAVSFASLPVPSASVAPAPSPVHAEPIVAKPFVAVAKPKPVLPASASTPPISASVPPAPSVKPKLPPGSRCMRGAECASGYCFAEQCQ